MIKFKEKNFFFANQTLFFAYQNRREIKSLFLLRNITQFLQS